jgi:anaerobic selenocysteine-containing dehydrogenase
VWAELSATDAAAHDVTDGDLVDVISPRGRVRAPARVTGIRSGVVFVPFHYGYWDADDDDGEHRRAANELTITHWDPVSKQPIYKTAACRIEKVADGADRPVPADGPSTQVTEELRRP